MADWMLVRRGKRYDPRENMIDEIEWIEWIVRFVPEGQTPSWEMFEAAGYGIEPCGDTGFGAFNYLTWELLRNEISASLKYDIRNGLVNIIDWHQLLQEAKAPLFPEPTSKGNAPTELQKARPPAVSPVLASTVGEQTAPEMEQGWQAQARWERLQAEGAFIIDDRRQQAGEEPGQTTRTAKQPPTDDLAFIQHENDRRIVMLWREGWTGAEIGTKLGYAEKTIYNKICNLRSAYGEDLVPERRKRKKKIVISEM